MVKIAIFVHIIISCLIIIGGYEAILGFRQLYGFSVSNHSQYALTGSFYNPGPYMGYLAMVLPGCVYVYVSGCTQILRFAQDDIIKRTSEKMDWAIRMVLETEPKVHSRAIDEMREEVKRMLRQ